MYTHARTHTHLLIMIHYYFIMLCMPMFLINIGYHTVKMHYIKLCNIIKTIFSIVITLLKIIIIIIIIIIMSIMFEMIYNLDDLFRCTSTIVQCKSCTVNTILPLQSQ